MQKVEFLESADEYEKNLDRLKNGIESRMEEKGNAILIALEERSKILPIRNLRLMKPLNFTYLTRCFEFFESLFVQDEQNALAVISKIVSAKRQLVVSQNILAR